MHVARTLVFASGVAWRRYVARPPEPGVAPGEPVWRPDARGGGRRLRGRAGGRTGGAVRPPVPGRILHLVTNALPEKNAGYTVRTHRIVRAQREIGLDAHVVTRLGFPVAQGHPAVRDRRDHDGVPYHRLIPWWPPKDPAAALARNVDLAGALVERLRPAVLHAATDHHNGQVALALRERYGIPVVYEVRGFLEDSWLAHDPRRRDTDPFYRARRARETACMQAADLVVTLGAAMRDDIVARGVDPAKVLIVPNAVDETFLAPLPDGAPLRAELGIEPGTVVIGTTTSFYRFEGLDVLIDAFAELRGSGAPVRLLLVGDGPERPALRRRAARLGVADVTHFTGRVPAEEIRRYHAVLDVFVVPRRNDRVCQYVTPLKPIEAMASGLPVVASDVKALREIVEPEVTGGLIPPEDSGALAKYLEKLVYTPELRRNMGRAGRDRINGDRTWKANAARYRDAYESLRVPLNCGPDRRPGSGREPLWDTTSW